MRCDSFRSLTAASAKPEDCGNGVVGTRLAGHSWLPSEHSMSAPSPRRARVLMKRGRLLPIFRNANTYTPKTMKQILTPFRILSTLALLALVVGCSGLPSKEHTLQTAGFTARVPKTASQQQKLKSLPPDKVTVVQEDGKTYYIFPDAAHNLAYVGGPKEYQTYRQIRSQQKEAEEIQWKENAEQIEWGGWGS
jgi:hypothetical protein